MIENMTGISLDYIVIGLCIVILVLLIITIVQLVKVSKLKKRINTFMKGKNAESLEDNLIRRLDEVDNLLAANADNERNIQKIQKAMKSDFTKYGIIKYDAFSENGGKLSFSLAMLDAKDNGFILSAVHSREGCYTYIKEIIAGNSVVILSEEEDSALSQALGES